MRRLLFAALAALATPAAAEDFDPIAAAQAWSADATPLRPGAPQVVVRGAWRWPGGVTVRLGQAFDGVPVVGHEIRLTYGTDGRLRRVRGDVVAAPLLVRNPALSGAQAAEIAATALRPRGEGQLWPARSSLAVHARGDRARLVWLVHASTAQPLGIWDLLVDAQDGTVVALRSAMDTAAARVYPTNPISSDLVDVELLGLGDSGTLAGENAFVNSCLEVGSQGFGGQACTDKDRFAQADGNGDFLVEPDPGSTEDPFAEVMMYHHVDRVSRWFYDRYGFTHGVPMEGIVNFEYQNAFYGDFDDDGIGEIAFGQYNGVDLAYDSDVIYHEYMHSVFGQIVSAGFVDADEYGLEWASAGLNEGSADALSLVLNQDPHLGEYAGRAFFGPLGTAIRELEEPRSCPTDLYGESHRDGEVWAALAWQLIQDERVGPERTADLYYGAVVGFPSDVNWAQAGQALADAADDLLAEAVIDQTTHDAILEHGDATGVVGCGRVNRLDEGQTPVQLMVHPGFFGDFNMPLAQQFSLDAPADAGRVRIRITDFVTNVSALGWRMYVRRGAHVVHDLEPLNTPFGNFEIPVPAEYDAAIDGYGDGFTLSLLLDGIEIEGDAEVSEGSLAALEPGETYYFSVASRAVGSVQGFANAEITVEGDVWTDPSLLGDDDDAADDDDAGGNACSGCGGGDAAWLLPLAPWLRRRRR